MRPAFAPIRGVPLLGFATAFTEINGRDDTPLPLPVVTPSRMGGILLPFACPHCSAVRSEPVNPRKRRLYHDDEGGFSWCPACRCRYVLILQGLPLAAPLPAGAESAPAQVVRNGVTETTAARPPHFTDSLNLLGAM